MDDASFLRSVLDEGGDPAVLVGHSSGGWVLTETGGHRSVKRLVYLDAVMPELGETHATFASGVAKGFAACVRVRPDATEFDTDALTAYLLSQGWSADDAREFASGFRPQRHVARVRALTVVAWQTVPSAFTCHASVINSQLRELFASRATDVIEIPGDHFPNWRRPDEVADIFARIAGDVVAQ